MIVGWVVSALAVLIWIYLAVGRGGFWRTSERLPPAAASAGKGRPDAAGPGLPSVVAVVPARDEGDLVPRSVPTLVAQDYAGPWRVVVVDDDSSDATAARAAAAGAQVVAGTGPPPGWAGKVAAMQLGVEAATQPGVEAAIRPGVDAATQTGVDAAAPPDFLLFTDADIAYPPHAVTALVRAATTHDLVQVSQMARLRADSFWERVIVPAFVYFFAQLYPFASVNRRGRPAAAAGGCMLVRYDALVAAGGLASMRDAVIDDVALAGRLASQGRLWLGLSDDIVSLRPYPRLADLWAMVTRSAYTQLRYSPLLLAGTVLGLVLTYLVPPGALVAGLVVGDPLLAALGGVAWLVMAATFVPMLRFYRLAPLRALTLPAIAALYAVMTLDSARRHRAGRGAAWKGRVRSRA